MEQHPLSGTLFFKILVFHLRGEDCILFLIQIFYCRFYSADTVRYFKRVNMIVDLAEEKPSLYANFIRENADVNVNYYCERLFSV